MSRVLPLALLVAVAALFVAGAYARRTSGLELDASSIAAVQDSLQELRSWVTRQGWAAPPAFIALVVFRTFLLLPSALVLTVGGLAFGVGLGTLLGTCGIALSAAMQFGISRGVGRDWVRRRLGERFRGFEARFERAGVGLVALITAHPAAPMSSAHWAAGLVSMSFVSFLAVVAVAGVIRAGLYAALGSSLVELPLWAAVSLGAALWLVAMLPLAHRGFRDRLMGASAATPPREQ